jgi:hypothetical protein
MVNKRRAIRTSNVSHPYVITSVSCRIGLCLVNLECDQGRHVDCRTRICLCLVFNAFCLFPLGRLSHHAALSKLQSELLTSSGTHGSRTQMESRVARMVLCSVRSYIRPSQKRRCRNLRNVSTRHLSLQISRLIRLTKPAALPPNSLDAETLCVT